MKIKQNEFVKKEKLFKALTKVEYNTVSAFVNIKKRKNLFFI